MPIAKLPFPELLPDMGDIENPGLYKASGAIYYSGRWSPAPYVHQGGGGLAFTLANIRGFHVHTGEDSNLSTQTIYFYIADTTNIYGSTVAGDLTLVDRTATALATATPGSGVQFMSFGNSVLATDFNSEIRRAQAPLSNFGNLVEFATPLTSYRPKARYITGIKNQVLIGHIQFGTDVMPTNSALTASTVYPSLVMWSAIDDPTRYGDPATTQNVAYDGSDYQLLADEYGAITGLVGGDYAYIFKERAIYRMDGPPYTFRPVVTGTGTLYCNSIVRYYDDVYYWGPSGPTVLRAGSSTPENLGMGKVSKTISDPSQSDIIDTDAVGMIPERMNVSVGRGIDIGGFADYRTGIIGWICSSPDVVTVQGKARWKCPGKVILYSVADNAFSYFYLSAPGWAPKTIPQYHYANVFGAAEVDGYYLSDTFYAGIGVDATTSTPGSTFVRGFGLDITSL